MHTYQIDINDQTNGDFEEAVIRAAVTEVLTKHDVRGADISIAIVNHARMRHLNNQHLQHDYETDVLSFNWQRNADTLEGEVIVSADMAREQSPRYGWTAQDELLLYVVHGMLHLVGFEDATPAERRRMSDAETEMLKRIGIVRPAAPTKAPPGDGPIAVEDQSS